MSFAQHVEHALHSPATVWADATSGIASTACLIASAGMRPSQYRSTNASRVPAEAAGSIDRGVAADDPVGLEPVHPPFDRRRGQVHVLADVLEGAPGVLAAAAQRFARSISSICGLLALCRNK